MIGWSACMGGSCLSVDFPVEGGRSWAGSSSGGLYPYHVCIYRSFPWVCCFFRKEFLSLQSRVCLFIKLPRNRMRKKGLAIYLLVSEFPFISPIFSVLYSILTFYSAWGADPSSPVGTSCFLQEQARCDPTAQWDLCPHAVSTSPSCVQLCLPCPRNLPTSYPELSVGIRPSASLCCRVAPRCFLPFRNVLRYSICCRVFPGSHSSPICIDLSICNSFYSFMVVCRALGGSRDSWEVLLSYLFGSSLESLFTLKYLGGTISSHVLK